MNTQPSVFIVDDDESIRKTLTRSLKHRKYIVQAFDSAQAFLADVDPGRPGCLVLDIAMPDISGLDLQTELSVREWPIPIIFITGHGDVPTSVRAIKRGAVEFLEKPFPLEVLLERIEEAFAMDAARRAEAQELDSVKSRFEQLTPREIDVMTLLAAGAAKRSNKVVARELGISHRTVDEYRARIMEKMQAESITHLVEMAKACGVYQP